MSNDSKENSSTNITVFNWNEFPVEKEKFSVCICLKNNQSSDEKINTNKILKYIKMMFPEETSSYTNVSDLVNYKNNIMSKTNLMSAHKSTMTININELSNIHWSENIAILQRFLDRGYFIIIGDYDKIPKIVTTTADIMIFDTEDTTNKYLGEKHRSQISNFNTDSHYILIDKRNLNMNIHGLSKDEINHYT